MLLTFSHSRSLLGLALRVDCLVVAMSTVSAAALSTVSLCVLPIVSVSVSVSVPSLACQTKLLSVAGSASSHSTPSTPSNPRAPPRDQVQESETPPLCLNSLHLCLNFQVLTHLSEHLSVLCSLVHFAVLSASACVAPSFPVQTCSHLTCQV